MAGTQVDHSADTPPCEELPPGAANVEDDVEAWEAEERRGRIKLVACRIALASAILGLWEYGTGRWFDAFWFSSPLRIARQFIVWAQDDLLHHLIITLRETFLGYAAGTLAGILLGTILARFTFAGKVLDPFILALNGIPRIALAPLFIIWFGIGEPSKIVLAGMLSFFLCFYATLSGLRSVDAAYVSIAKVMGADERQTFFKVVLPAASPWIITAMKVSVPFALVGAIVGEFMAATGGLGFKIQLYTAQFDTTGAVTGVFVLMLVVVLFNTALDRLEAHVLRWRPETSAGRGSEVQ
jgi:NitT/TauT family transport system permease protein